MKNYVQHSKPYFSGTDVNAVIDVVNSGMVAEGRLAESFVSSLAEIYGAYGGVPASSGAAALRLALECSGLAPGAKIVCPTYICAEVPNAILAGGYVPYFIDTDIGLDLNAEQAKEASEFCEGIVVPHLFGVWNDHSYLTDYYSYVVEDFAQCVYRPKAELLPLIGNMGFFSFQGTKPLVCGEGGIVLGKRSSEAKKLKEARYINGSRYGANLSPLSDLQAALGLAQLSKLDELFKRQRDIASMYLEAFTDVSGVEFPDYKHTTWYRFPLRIASGVTDSLIKKFDKLGIAVRRPCSTLCHNIFSASSGGSGSYSGALQLYNETLSIPSYPALLASDVLQVINVVKKIFG